MPKTRPAYDPTAPRGTRGLGSLYQREIGGIVYWHASRSFTVIDPVTGEKTRRRATGTGVRKQDALDALERKLHPETAPAKPGPARGPKPYTFEEWFTIWLSEIPERRVSDIVRRKYRRMAETYIFPTFGDRPVAMIEEEDVRDLFLHLEREPMFNLSLGTVRNIHRVLHMCLKAATETRRIPISKNPAAAYKPAPKVSPVTNIDKELDISRKFIAWLHESRHPEECRWLFMYTGMRRSERLAMSWSNVYNLEDDDNARVEVAQQIARHDDGSGWYVKPRLKTDAGHRSIPLVEPFLTALRHHKMQWEEAKERVEATGAIWGGEDGTFADFVFLQLGTGRPILPNRDVEEWNKLIGWFSDGNGFRGHISRHVSATILAESGVDHAVAREVIGHKSSSMFYWYAKVSDRRKRPALQDYATNLTSGFSEETKELDAARTVARLSHMNLMEAMKVMITSDKLGPDFFENKRILEEKSEIARMEYMAALEREEEKRDLRVSRLSSSHR